MVFARVPHFQNMFELYIQLANHGNNIKTKAILCSLGTGQFIQQNLMCLSLD